MGGIINGTAAPDEDWAELLHLERDLFGTNGLKSADGAVDNTDIANALDTAHDGVVNLREIASLASGAHAGPFASLKVLLKIYGFDIYAKTDLVTVLDEEPQNKDFDPLWRDRDFVLAAVTTDGTKLRFADHGFRHDGDILIAAIKSSPESFSLAAGNLAQDRNFCLKAVKINGLVLAELPARFRHDREIVLAAVDNDGGALDMAPEDFRADYEIVMAAVQGSGMSLDDAAPHLKSDPDIVLAALNANGLALAYADVTFQDSEEFVLAAATENQRALLYASERLRDSPEFIQRVVAKNGLAFQYASDLVKRDRRVLTAAILQNPMAFLFAIPESVNASLLTAYFEMDQQTPPPEILNANPADLIREWAAFTSYPERFGDFDTFLKAWQTSRTLGKNDDTRPIALLLYNDSDWNGAFATYSLPKTLVDSDKFRVVYREVSSDKEAARAIEDVATQAKQSVHTLVFAGHGSKTSLVFGSAMTTGNRTTSQSIDESELNRWDFAWDEFRKLDDYLDDNGQILFYACLNGKGGTKAANLANAAAKRVGPGVTISSCRTSSNIDEVAIADNLILNVTWFSDYSYVTRGKKTQGATESK